MCATPLHFVPFANISRAVTNMLINGIVRGGKRTTEEVRGSWSGSTASSSTGFLLNVLKQLSDFFVGLVGKF